LKTPLSGLIQRFQTGADQPTKKKGIKMETYATDSLQVLSLLLQYPDDELFRRLDPIRSAAEDFACQDIQSSVHGFIDDLERLTPLRAQECYTAVFDMNPSTTLNLTYHTYGDNEKRAAALARLQQAYVQAGWERISGELPDYLPLMLEFLSICRHPAHTAPVWRCLCVIDGLIEKLKPSAPAYAALLQPLARMAAKRRASNPGSEHRSGKKTRQT
jgi:nitrate reductase molybdenum cofactor assembly chaperone NarJ/NarW